AVLPKGLLDALRDHNTDLITLGMAHLLFGKWLLAWQAPVDEYMYDCWCAFIERFPFAEKLAPTQLGLCGNNPACFSPLNGSCLPAEPVSKIKRSGRELTAWYAVDIRSVSTFLEKAEKYPVTLEKALSIQDEREALASAEQFLEMAAPKWHLAFRGLTNATNERTVISSILPTAGVGNSAPLLLCAKLHPELYLCLVGNLNSIVLDFVARQKIGGTNLNFFIVEQFPVLPPSHYNATDITYVASRVLELVYTANDMEPLANAVRSSKSSIEKVVPEAPYRWDDARRAILRAELDAWYARAYGLTRDELRYILDPTDVYGPDFPSETFRVLKEKELKQFGEYRTRRLVLDAWDGLERNSIKK
ncbi:MAG: SAM-dependent DNA methyltransferase, partial [bacterium]